MAIPSIKEIAEITHTKPVIMLKDRALSFFCSTS
jgi:hypothetical protein